MLAPLSGNISCHDCELGGMLCLGRGSNFGENGTKVAFISSTTFDQLDVNVSDS